MKTLTFSLIFTFTIFCTSTAQTLDTLIDVGTHKLHFKIIKGSRTPILFEAGNGDDGSVWEPIVNEIHKATQATIITYDRAGLGLSEIDTTTISFQQEIKDLETALIKLGFNDGIMNVSHSFGGFYSILFASKNPSKIKGAVFIDTALPCSMTQEWSQNFISNISEEDWKLIKTHKIGLYYVLKNLSDISNYMSNKTLPAALPVTIIGAEIQQPYLTPNEQQQWIDCQEAFGALPNHKYVQAQGAHHKIWKDKPQLVIDEIVQMYNRVN
ncbi:alpha/beta fold hydrolase [Fulvivirga ligni]|uniref:alpha/beta fold hydrolase n=1 Tax=Fulvivirga ligni TaxID=2904246 RepID=UPI001F254D52|nr:alpha/beta hydrolase [Fulvivirga ligni]UII19928.1 alpha/beta hydrolase [Fulvivirga ligni]